MLGLLAALTQPLCLVAHNFLAFCYATHTMATSTNRPDSPLAVVFFVSCSDNWLYLAAGGCSAVANDCKCPSRSLQCPAATSLPSPSCQLHTRGIFAFSAAFVQPLLLHIQLSTWLFWSALAIHLVVLVGFGCPSWRPAPLQHPLDPAATTLFTRGLATTSTLLSLQSDVGSTVHGLLNPQHTKQSLLCCTTSRHSPMRTVLHSPHSTACSLIPSGRQSLTLQLF